MKKRHVLIVGGGFGGIKAALKLADRDDFKVTLLSDKPSFHYHPMLYHTATGGKRSISEIPLAEILENKNIEIAIGTAEILNREHKTLKTSAGEIYHYDIVILALGAITNYFGVEGLKEYSYGIKSIGEAEELKKHLHDQLIDENQPDLNYIVVGGGPTGIETAGALPAYVKHIMKLHGLRDRKIHVDLIEALPRLAPRMPKSVSRALARRMRRLGVKLYLNTPVQAETADALLVGGKPLSSHTVIWTAGVANNPFYEKNHFLAAPNHKIQVDKLLQAWPGIFVIGDNADTPYSGMAQTALHDGEFVAENLIRHAEDKPPFAYKPKRPIYVTPAGEGWAAVVWGKFEIYGRVGWLLRQAADWIGYKDLEPWWRAAGHMLDTLDSEDSCPVCAQSEA